MTKKAREITVRDANQGFSKLIAKVERGLRYVVTKNGRPVAKIEPMDANETAEARRAAATARLEALMEKGARSADGWTYRGDRDALHDRSA